MSLFQNFKPDRNLADASFLVPIPKPNKIFLLAGNYAEHIREGGGIALERAETFPYVFMKPASTTLNDPYKPIRIPAVSPDAIDWELELGVIIGRNCKAVKEADALSYVAGYTIINDISNRKFRPNAGRKKREKDVFFDWLHGKWFDSFCPMGPWLVSADEMDGTNTHVRCYVNGEERQNAATPDLIFDIPTLIETLSAGITLYPGDVIATGTPVGVGIGFTPPKYLKSGDVVRVEIDGIGVLENPVK